MTQTLGIESASLGEPRRSVRLRHKALAIALVVLTPVGAGCRSDESQTRAPSAYHHSDADLAPSTADASKQKLKLLEAQAALCEMDHKSSDAIELYESILRTAPKHSDALHRLAILHIQNGNSAGAKSRFQEALELSVENALLHNDYGYFCYLQGDADGASRHLKQALTLDPKLLQAHNNLGLVLASMGRFAEAEIEFQRAGCTRAEALSNVALVRALATDVEGAAATYQFALQIDPNQSNARRGLDSLNKLNESQPHSVNDPRTYGAVRTVSSVGETHSANYALSFANASDEPQVSPPR
jgi:Tfp pilus assembly protein PilF